MKLSVKIGVVMLAALLAGCGAAPALPEPGDAKSPNPASHNVQLYEVATIYDTYNVEKFCDGPNAVYILEGYRGIAVSPNDPFCPTVTRGPGAR